MASLDCETSKNCPMLTCGLSSTTLTFVAFDFVSIERGASVASVDCSSPNDSSKQKYGLSSSQLLVSVKPERMSLIEEGLCEISEDCSVVAEEGLVVVVAASSSSFCLFRFH